ncbi:hypothetical protein H4R26_001568 [Coemansia thaxteri]|uniref:Uncharacterized protein n=1 Tax=Coemansia thaxteri TaxID=2663907 RepID=A0A9W8BGA7_9FUNG|nr:hypothetical protein H4R26_001568 [Coemansia thaxteri]
MRRIAKLLQGLLGLAAAGIESVSVRWLGVATALNIYAQLWRVYASVLSQDSGGGSTAPPYLRSIGGDWLIFIVSAMSYAGLALLLLLLPILVARLALVMARQLQAPLELKSAIEPASLLLVSLFTAISNHAGIIDITSMPLVADIFLVVWKCCAVASAALALIALPAYVTSTMRQSRGQRLLPYSRGSLDTADVAEPLPWFLLLLPAIAASASAGDLTMVLQPRDASDALINSFVLWGAAVAPALVFTASYIRYQVTRYSLSQPGSNASSPLDVVFPSAIVSQLAFAIMSLGIQSRRVWADTVGPSTAPLLLGELAMAAGAILGLVLWASSAAWLINAHVLVIHKFRRLRQEDQRHASRIALILSSDAVLHISAPRRVQSALARTWQRISALSACHAVYPQASFALATAYVARIWDSSIALHLTQLMLAYLTLLMAVALVKIPHAAVSWVIASARRMPLRSTLPTVSQTYTTASTASTSRDWVSISSSRSSADIRSTTAAMAGTTTYGAI